MDTATIECGHRPDAVADARHWLVAQLRAHGLADLEDDAALLVTELTTNALAHTPGGFAVELHIDGGTVDVDVRDDAPPFDRPPASLPHASGGRGLEIVDVLADDWGVHERERGKTVWFRLSRR